MNRLIVTVAFALIAVQGAGCGDRQMAKAELEQAQVVKIVKMQPRRMEFVEKIPIQGNVESQQSADISSRTSGNIDQIPVGEGDRVKKGQLLFEIDRVNLENNVKAQQEKVAVAEADYKIARINAELAETVRQKAKIDYDRALQLKSSNAISQDAYENAKLKYDEAVANIAKTQAQSNYALAQLNQEKANLEICRKTLADSIVKSPFEGVVVVKDMDPDEYVQTGSRILRLENPDRLELVSMISANYYARVIPGKTTGVIRTVAGEEITLPVTFRSPSVDALSRTFTVKIQLPPGKGFVSGQLYTYDLILNRVEGVGIPNEAVLTRGSGRKAVFVVTPRNTAEEVTEKTGIVDGPWTMLLDPAALKGLPVVAEGQAFLEPGDKVEETQASAAGQEAQ